VLPAVGDPLVGDAGAAVGSAAHRPVRRSIDVSYVKSLLEQGLARFYGGHIGTGGCGRGGVSSMADIRRLPVPVTDIWDWQMQGACRGMDSAFFFHPEGERGPAREARAKEVCRRCPVLEQCRRHALAVQEPYGVWGGLSEAERDEITRGRTRRLRIPTGSAETMR
jgi:WhiB family transcriptional regulator, redox-sensing transcriptional regulator